MTRLNKEELVAKDLQYKIYKNVLQTDDKISERSISNSYVISRGTARCALTRLEKMGVIRKRESIGYFVNYPKKDHFINFISKFNKIYSYLNLNPDFDKYDILSERFIDTNKILSQKFQLPLGTKIIFSSFRVPAIKNDSNLLLNKIFLPINTDLYISEKNISDKIQKAISNTQNINATLSLTYADKEISQALQVEYKKPLSCVSATFKNTKDQNIFFLTQYSDIKSSASILPSQIITKKVGGFIE